MDDEAGQIGRAVVRHGLPGHRQGHRLGPERHGTARPGKSRKFQLLKIPNQDVGVFPACLHQERHRRPGQHPHSRRFSGNAEDSEPGMVAEVGYFSIPQ